MYFNEFESYQQTMEKSKSFIVRVVTTDGSSVQSSAIPMMLMPQVLMDMSAVEETRTMFTIWSRGGDSKLTAIPYEQIKHIEILFAPS